MVIHVVHRLKPSRRVDISSSKDRRLAHTTAALLALYPLRAWFPSRGNRLRKECGRMATCEDETSRWTVDSCTAKESGGAQTSIEEARGNQKANGNLMAAENIRPQSSLDSTRLDSTRYSRLERSVKILSS